MTNLEKKAWYDELCQFITDYEEDEPYRTMDEDLYIWLCNLANCWDELTNEEDV
jgi:hypothetical protein